ncbi:hypothetical protein J6590_095132 [Homalodisca vitripennis]|nr:hypothetical protein J6590_045928 [Homalodisca vitripennis]KAG8304387.1 hypothetical protein J6590_095132 [Homalodisca vitripennis]
MKTSERESDAHHPSTSAVFNIQDQSRVEFRNYKSTVEPESGRIQLGHTWGIPLLLIPGLSHAPLLSELKPHQSTVSSRLLPRLRSLSMNSFGSPFIARLHFTREPSNKERVYDINPSRGPDLLRQLMSSQAC